MNIKHLESSNNYNQRSLNIFGKKFLIVLEDSKSNKYLREFKKCANLK